MPTRFAPVCGLLLTQRRTPQISALDMTCEAVVTKMAYLLSLNVPTPRNPPCPQLHCFEFEPLFPFFSLLNSSPPPSSLPPPAAPPQQPQRRVHDVAARRIDRWDELRAGAVCRRSLLLQTTWTLQVCCGARTNAAGCSAGGAVAGKLRERLHVVAEMICL